MSILPAALFFFDFFEPLPIQIEVSDAPLTSDAGLLPPRRFDERIGLTRQFAAVLDDPRDPELQDPLGKGQPVTWRLLLIKVAATVIVSCRRIVVRLSGSWPNQQFFEQVRQHVCRRPAVAHFWTG